MSGCNVFSELLLHSVQFQSLYWCILWKPALGPTDVAWLLAAWNIRAQSFLPLVVFFWSTGSFFLNPYVSFLVSTHFLTLFSLFVFIKPTYSLLAWIHPDSFWCCFWCCCMLWCVFLCIQYFQIPPYQDLKGHMMVWKFRQAEPLIVLQ